MDRRIELVISKIEIEISAAWNTTALANVIDLSPSRFRHLFKQETGTSPAQYLKQLRMQRAELLLRTTFLSVKEVLKQVGISSNSHFVTDFKKVHGMTPTAFRRAFGRAARLRQSREKGS
jgi:AraC-like DNA-binding protein